ncbi:hypothetical protein SteCoe_11987 [Stentor coeruleus]|uniref:Uncharacterized protein n=1 Tax=Stentor coeruleus TaxID=5963 RepID=A0A1R2CBW7_9CILI|nr:hypothetical protein SteCoe_11987 [Stentor coeruleus]
MKTGQTLFNKLLDVYIEMKMNEFEFSLWVLIMEKALTDNASEPMEKFIKYSAYAAKTFTNKDIRLLDVELEGRCPGFYAKAQRWVKLHMEYALITPQEINRKYNELSLSILCKNEDYYINYGKIVEELVNNWIKNKESAQSLKPENIDI